jgi:hypothetical protein
MALSNAALRMMRELSDKARGDDPGEWFFTVEPGEEPVYRELVALALMRRTTDDGLELTPAGLDWLSENRARSA